MSYRDELSASLAKQRLAGIAKANENTIARLRPQVSAVHANAGIFSAVTCATHCLRMIDQLLSTDHQPVESSVAGVAHVLTKAVISLEPRIRLKDFPDPGPEAWTEASILIARAAGHLHTAAPEPHSETSDVMGDVAATLMDRACIMVGLLSYPLAMARSSACFAAISSCLGAPAISFTNWLSPGGLSNLLAQTVLDIEGRIGAGDVPDPGQDAWSQVSPLLAQTADHLATVRSRSMNHPPDLAAVRLSSTLMRRACLVLGADPTPNDLWRNT